MQYPVHNMTVLETRPTAKGLIAVAPDQYLLVSGSRGQLGLIGGGIDPTETALEALYREAAEEVSVTPDMLDGVHLAGSIAGITRSCEGVKRVAKWTVFAARLNVTVDSLVIPDSTENKDMAVLSEAEAHASPLVYELTKRAMQMVLHPSSVVSSRTFVWQ